MWVFYSCKLPSLPKPKNCYVKLSQLVSYISLAFSLKSTATQISTFPSYRLVKFRKETMYYTYSYLRTRNGTFYLFKPLLQFIVDDFVCSGYVA